MPDTSELFKSGDLLAPSSAEINIAFTTAGVGTLATTQLGTIATLQTSAQAAYNTLTLPSFSGKTGKNLQQAFVVPENSRYVGVFNSTGTELEAILGPAAMVRMKALNSTTAGTPILKIGQSGIRTLWPLDQAAIRNVDTGGTLDSNTFVGQVGPNPFEAAALSSTLSVVVFLDSNRDVKMFATNCNADGTDRAVSTVTTVRSNANNLSYPQVVKLDGTRGLIQWWDATATMNEFCAFSVTDANPPVISLGAVLDDTVAVGTAGDRVGSFMGGLEADFGSSSNFAAWYAGSCSTVGNGQRAYRLSVNTGTLATTIHHTLRYSASVAAGGNVHKGVSPATDRFLCLGMTAASDTRLYYLQYSPSTITQAWQGDVRTNEMYGMTSHTKLSILNLANNEFTIEASDATRFVMGIIQIPSMASGSNHRLKPLAGAKTFFSNLSALASPILLEGEAIWFPGGYTQTMAYADLFSVQKPGYVTAADTLQPVMLPWIPMIELGLNGPQSGAVMHCVDVASRRITVFRVQIPASGNTRIIAVRHLWPKR
jgi:hypothetical protein